MSPQYRFRSRLVSSLTCPRELVVQRKSQVHQAHDRPGGGLHRHRHGHHHLAVLACAPAPAAPRVEVERRRPRGIEQVRPGVHPVGRHDLGQHVAVRIGDGDAVEGAQGVDRLDQGRQRLPVPAQDLLRQKRAVAELPGDDLGVRDALVVEGVERPGGHVQAVGRLLLQQALDDLPPGPRRAPGGDQHQQHREDGQARPQAHPPQPGPLPPPARPSRPAHPAHYRPPPPPAVRRCGRGAHPRSVPIEPESGAPREHPVPRPTCPERAA